MNRNPAFTRSLRKIAPLTASPVLVAATVIAGAGPASAVAPSRDMTPNVACHTEGGINATDTFVAAFRVHVCGMVESPLTTTIQKRVGAGWVTVATGRGSARYTCKGHTKTTYKLASTTFTATANCS